MCHCYRRVRDPWDRGKSPPKIFLPHTSCDEAVLVVKETNASCCPTRIVRALAYTNRHDTCPQPSRTHGCQSNCRPNRASQSHHRKCGDCFGLHRQNISIQWRLATRSNASASVRTRTLLAIAGVTNCEFRTCPVCGCPVLCACQSTTVVSVNGGPYVVITGAVLV